MFSRATGLRVANRALSAGVNRYLDLDPHSLERAAALDGRSLALRIEGLDAEVTIQVRGSRLCFVEEVEGGADTQLSGAPFSLMRMLLEQGTRALFAGDVVIEGDPEVAKRFKRLFDTVDVDWEEQLSQVVGDYPARKLLRALRSFARWQRRGGDSLSADARDYLQEEAGTLVHGYPAEDWYDGVDRLRDDVERLEARLHRLSRSADR